ncbi:unnamed protein product [Rhizophagus irregularis]|nr:unnamed protein product [Rhizophagus irregularis]
MERRSGRICRSLITLPGWHCMNVNVLRSASDNKKNIIGSFSISRLYCLNADLRSADVDSVSGGSAGGNGGGRGDDGGGGDGGGDGGDGDGDGGGGGGVAGDGGGGVDITIPAIR